MWYQLNETDIGKLRVGDMLMKHSTLLRPEFILPEKNEFFIISSFKEDVIEFKKADIVQSSINYSTTSLETHKLFENYYWYCFQKRNVS